MVHNYLHRSFEIFPRFYATMTKYCCSYDDVVSAMKRIRPHVHLTPLMTSSTLDVMSGRKIFLKTENFQKTGSFKIRGATNAVLKIKENFPDVDCVVTNSSGNHGQALAKAASVGGFKCHIVMPETSPKCKIDAVRGHGANVVLCAPTEDAREQGTQQLLEEFGGKYVNGSQEPDVIAGGGTIGIEMMEQCPNADVIVAAVGGGGMISGISLAVKSINPNVKVIAAEPEIADDCYVSKKTGVRTPNAAYPDTIADGVKVSIGPNTWPIVRDFVDDVITVSEDEIKLATLLVWERCKLVIEPTAGVAVAAVLSDKFQSVQGKNVVVLLCGGNVDMKSISSLTMS